MSQDVELTRMTCIPKTNIARRGEEYGVLSPVPHASKILTRMMYYRMERRTEESLQEDKFGFRRNRGTHKAILDLRLITEKSLRLNKETIIVLMALKRHLTTWIGLQCSEC